MFRTKQKRDRSMIKEIERQLEIEMDLANEALDRHKVSLKESDLYDYYFHKGRFGMCAGLLSQIKQM